MRRIRHMPTTNESDLFIAPDDTSAAALSAQALGRREVWLGLSEMFLPLPILQLQWLPLSSVIAFLNFFDRNSKRMRLLFLAATETAIVNRR